MHITTFWNAYTGVLLLQSDCKEVIPLESLKFLVVQINGEVQEKFACNWDIDGYLYI